jgi:hypothetical protein
MDSTREFQAFERSHRPYASMNWIRFNGSLRATAVSQPLAGTPLVNVQRLRSGVAGVKTSGSRHPPLQSTRQPPAVDGQDGAMNVVGRG